MASNSENNHPTERTEWIYSRRYEPAKDYGMDVPPSKVECHRPGKFVHENCPASALWDDKPDHHIDAIIVAVHAKCDSARRWRHPPACGVYFGEGHRLNIGISFDEVGTRDIRCTELLAAVETLGICWREIIRRGDGELYPKLNIEVKKWNSRVEAELPANSRGVTQKRKRSDDIGVEKRVKLEDCNGKAPAEHSKTTPMAENETFLGIGKERVENRLSANAQENFPPQPIQPTLFKEEVVEMDLTLDDMDNIPLRPIEPTFFKEEAVEMDWTSSNMEDIPLWQTKPTLFKEETFEVHSTSRNKENVPLRPFKQEGKAIKSEISDDEGSIPLSCVPQFVATSPAGKKRLPLASTVVQPKISRLIVKTDSEYLVHIMTRYMFPRQMEGWADEADGSTNRIKKKSLLRNLNDLVRDLNNEGVEVLFWEVNLDENIVAAAIAEGAIEDAGVVKCEGVDVKQK